MNKNKYISRIDLRFYIWTFFENYYTNIFDNDYMGEQCTSYDFNVYQEYLTLKKSNLKRK